MSSFELIPPLVAMEMARERIPGLSPAVLQEIEGIMTGAAGLRDQVPT